MMEVTLEDFARSFGTTTDDFSEKCKTLIAKGDFTYEILTSDNVNTIILNVLKTIETDTQIIGSDERKDVWHRGWKENLQQFIESGYCFNTLIPKFIRKNQVIRYDGQFIKPHNPHFELDYMTVFRTWLFQKYFQNQNTIYEFGCGTGLNLVLIDDLLPGKKLYGLDFVNSSVDLIEKIGTCRNGYIKGRLFDMINPDNDFNLDNECAVFTFGVIEQLAGKFENFLQFLLKNKPHVCLHVEPTIELYDEDILFDYLAMMYHRKRGYTEGFLPRLKELESCGKLKILKTKRLFFGSQFMEGYMYFVWQPL